MGRPRVLHVVANLRHGGVQSWILELARQAQRDGLPMDVLAYGNEAWPLTDALLGLGVTIHECQRHRDPAALYGTLRELERKYHYGAIHCHEMFHNGTLVLLAAILGIPVRISHAHNSSQAVKSSLIRRFYNGSMKLLLRGFATKLLAVSNLAGMKLYGSMWLKDGRSEIVHCGLDFSPYAADRQPMRHSLGIPEGKKIIGHVGRFVDQKNHDFLIDIVNVAMKRDPEVWLILVGDGPTRKKMEQKVNQLGMADRTLFAGARSDIAALMIDVIDVLLLPSKFEGLGLVILEAMAAGKRSVVSDVVPIEADVVPDLITRVSLDRDSSTWADAVAAALGMPDVSRQLANEAVQASPFSARPSYEKMLSIYRLGSNVEAKVDTHSGT